MLKGTFIYINSHDCLDATPLLGECVPPCPRHCARHPPFVLFTPHQEGTATALPL